MCMHSVCSSSLLATDCAWLSAVQRELPCSLSSSTVYSAVGAGCHMWLHVRLCRSMQQQEQEGDLLCSQLFRPVLTVLWSCVGEIV